MADLIELLIVAALCALCAKMAWQVKQLLSLVDDQNKLITDLLDRLSESTDTTGGLLDVVTRCAEENRRLRQERAER